MPLTDTKLRSYLNKKRDKQLTLTDRDSMSARITPKGKIVFQYRYRVDGSSQLNQDTFPKELCSYLTGDRSLFAL
jgi:hypothetical protein